MTVKELWKHCVNLPSSLCLGSNGTAEITQDSDRMQELVDQYGDRRVKKWQVGCFTPGYYLIVVVESETETFRREDNG